MPPALAAHVTQELGKGLILILNKVDLTPPAVAVAWSHLLRGRFGPARVVPFTSAPAPPAPPAPGTALEGFGGAWGALGWSGELLGSWEGCRGGEGVAPGSFGVLGDFRVAMGGFGVVLGGPGGFGVALGYFGVTLGGFWGPDSLPPCPPRAAEEAEEEGGSLEPGRGTPTAAGGLRGHRGGGRSVGRGLWGGGEGSLSVP